MRVECEVEEGDVEDDRGNLRPGVVVTCGRCKHAVESLGQTDRSIRRCFALLREECPEGEENYYCEEGDA